MTSFVVDGVKYTVREGDRFYFTVRHAEGAQGLVGYFNYDHAGQAVYYTYCDEDGAPADSGSSGYLYADTFEDIAKWLAATHPVN